MPPLPRVRCAAIASTLRSEWLFVIAQGDDGVVGFGDLPSRADMGSSQMPQSLALVSEKI